MGLFLWHDRRQASRLTVAGKKVLVVVLQWPFKGVSVSEELSTCFTMVLFPEELKSVSTKSICDLQPRSSRWTTDLKYWGFF